MSRFDLDSSLEQYQEIKNQEVLTEVVENHVNVLSCYKVTLDDLLKASPKQRVRRQALQKTAVAFSFLFIPNIAVAIMKNPLPTWPDTIAKPTVGKGFINIEH